MYSEQGNLARAAKTLANVPAEDRSPRMNFALGNLYDQLKQPKEAAKAYQAACTPDFYLFDGQRRLVYRGQLDDARPGNGKPVDGKDIRAAIEAVLAGRTPSTEQLPSIGCNIKWRPGHEPNYAS